MSEPLIRALLGVLAKTSSRATLSIPGYDCALGSSVGIVRNENQDRVVAASALGTELGDRRFRMFAVADGIGGMRAGADCAAQSLATMVAFLLTSQIQSPEKRLTAAFDAANARVHASYGGEGGTTLAAVMFTSTGEVLLASVGDSRIYGFGEDWRLTRLTTDDTIEAHVATAKGTPSSALKGRLVQFIGMGEGLIPSISTLGRGDGVKGLLLATDGMSEIDEQSVCRLLRNSGDARTAVDRLLHVCDWLGGHDNSSITAIYPGAMEALRMPASQGSHNSIWSPGTATRLQLVPMGLGPHTESASPRPEPDRESTTSNATARNRKAGSRKKRQRQTRTREADAEGNDVQVDITFVEEK